MQDRKIKKQRRWKMTLGGFSFGIYIIIIILVALLLLKLGLGELSP